MRLVGGRRHLVTGLQNPVLKFLVARPSTTNVRSLDPVLFSREVTESLSSVNMVKKGVQVSMAYAGNGGPPQEADEWDVDDGFPSADQPVGVELMSRKVIGLVDDKGGSIRAKPVEVHPSTESTKLTPKKVQEVVAEQNVIQAVAQDQVVPGNPDPVVP